MGKNKDSTSVPSSHVRFTNDEYKIIHEDSLNLEETIPTLLKRNYFKKRVSQPIISHSDAKKIHVALNRVGNNINQIAKDFNSGKIKDWYPEFQEMVEIMRGIRNLVCSFGRGKS